MRYNADENVGLLKKKTPTMLQILEILIYEGPQNIEAISLKIGKHYTTAMRRLKEMYEMLWVHTEEQLRSLDEETQRSFGDGPQRYVVAEKGLIVYFLTHSKEALSRFEEIAERHSDMFLTFKWYPYFVSKGLGDVIKDRFMLALMNTRSEMYFTMMLLEENISPDDLDQFSRYSPYFSEWDRVRLDRVTFGFNNFLFFTPKSLDLRGLHLVEGKGFVISKNSLITSFEASEGLGRLREVLEAVDENSELYRFKLETLNDYSMSLGYMKEDIEGWIDAKNLG